MLQHAKTLKAFSFQTNIKHWIVALTLAVAATSGVILSTRLGINIGGDSLVYANSAQCFSAGLGAVVQVAGNGVEPLTRFPPMTTWFLALGPKLGMTVPAFARIAFAIFYGMLVLISFALLTGCIRSLLIACVATAWIALSPTLLWLNSSLMSESIFLLVLAFMWLSLIGFLRHPSLVWFACAMLSGCVLPLTRYAGLPFIVAGMATMLLLGSSPLRSRILAACSFGALSIAPLAIVILSRSHSGTNLTDRSIAWHPMDIAHIQELLATVYNWITPLILQHGNFRIGCFVLAAGATAALVVLLFGTAIDLTFCASRAAWQPLYVLCLLSCAMYILFLIFSICFLDFFVGFGVRLMSPIFLAATFMFGILLDHHIHAKASSNPRLTQFCVLLAIYLVAGKSLNWVHDVKQYCRSGAAMHSVGVFQHSNFGQRVMALAPDGRVLTNSAYVTYFATGAMPHFYPEIFDRSTNRRNERYKDEMAKLSKDIVQQHLTPLYFYACSGGDDGMSCPTPSQIQTELNLTPAWSDGDGIIFRPK